MSREKTKKKKDGERFAVGRIVSDFLEFFAAKGHTVVPGAPLLPADPTLLFTAAGMVPFKAYYSDPSTAPYPRVASVQKCLRAGGKQSDLENVGRTLRHHTFFEMLGNFSFGDYFKREAIEYGWELSVDVWGMDKDSLWVSVYEEDDDAFEIWTGHMGFPKSRVVRLGKKENFWGPVGDTGVCGPSTEMYVDTGKSRGCGKKMCRPGCDCDRYIEYWNLVFPQFFFSDQGNYDLLPKPGIDTGLGVERVAFILQGAQDNFHTDEFAPIRRAVAAALPGKELKKDASSVAVNVASDHVRALTFAMAEGIMPSNEGRGYVLRRLLRRALTKMHPFGVREPFLAGAVDAVVTTMGGRYPEIVKRASVVKEMITAEEERFISTLEQGLDRLRGIIDQSKKSGRIPGADIFLLYDTFGFPPELTGELAEEHGLGVDQGGFDRAMGEQKERARRKSFHAADARDAVPFVSVREVDDTEFLGYDDLSCDGEVSAFRIPDPCRLRPRAPRDRPGLLEVITDKTVFYPEGGGQVGDTGAAVFDADSVDVLDAYQSDRGIVHLVDWGSPIETAKLESYFQDHPSARLVVDPDARPATERNHTATHLLHAALRGVLGDHVAQAGSLVEAGRLRFDFHHYQAMRPEEIKKVQDIVNDAVLSDTAVSTDHMSYNDAIAAGAMALFGEKYGDEVRVVTIEDISRELCGGTHLSSTGEMGTFLIAHESAVGSGVRRVEALTGKGALDYVAGLVRGRETVAGMLKVGLDDVEHRLHTLLEENEALRARVRKDDARKATDVMGDAINGAGEVKGVKLVSLAVDAGDVGALRQYGDALRGRLDLGLGVLCQADADKPVVLLVASDRLIKEKSVGAGDLTRRIADSLGFRGGGKPHMAQVGIPSTNEFNKIVDFVKATLESLL